jgi:hypothetical protein
MAEKNVPRAIVYWKKALKQAEQVHLAGHMRPVGRVFETPTLTERKTDLIILLLIHVSVKDL